MPLDTTELSRKGSTKATPHDNCKVLDIGSGNYPRFVEVQVPGSDGARQTALWDGSLDLAVNDKVLCHEYAGSPTWRIMTMGSNEDGSGRHRVSKLHYSDFSAVAAQSDASGNVGIGTSGPDAKLDVLDTGGAQLRLTHTDGSVFVDFTLDSGDDLTITPSSTGKIILQPTTDSTTFVQVLDADGGSPVLNVDSTNERVGIGTAAPASQLHLLSGTNMIIRAQTSLTNGVARFELINDAQQWNIGVNASDAITFFNNNTGKSPIVIDPATSYSNLLHVGASFVVINDDGADADFRLEGDTDANLIYANAGTDRVGIGSNSPAAKFHVDQASTTAAIPVALLDQADVDEPFMKFIGEAASATLTRSIVDEGDVSTATRIGWAKIEIDDVGNQVTDGDYFIPFYTLA